MTVRQEAQALADAVLENKWNPKGLRRNHRGELLDKWGRVMNVDWPEFDKKRMVAGAKHPQWPKVLNPLHAAATPRKVAEGEDPKSFFRQGLPRRWRVHFVKRTSKPFEEVRYNIDARSEEAAIEAGWARLHRDVPTRWRLFRLYSVNLHDPQA